MIEIFLYLRGYIRSFFKDKYFDVVTSISTIEHIGFNNDIYNYGGFKGKIEIYSN